MRKQTRSLMFNGLLVCCVLIIFSCIERLKATLERENTTEALTAPKTIDVEALIKQDSVERQEKPIILEAQDKQGSESEDSIRTYNLDSGQKVKVKGNTIVIYHSGGKVMAENIDIIRRMDETFNCPSEGFIDIVTKGNYFTIEQQNCSGWYFIAEYITFKYSESDGIFLLHKFVLRYMDRRDPDKKIEEKVHTSKDFGEVSFEDVNIDSLYEYNR